MKQLPVQDLLMSTRFNAPPVFSPASRSLASRVRLFLTEDADEFTAKWLASVGGTSPPILDCIAVSYCSFLAGTYLQHHWFQTVATHAFDAAERDPGDFLTLRARHQWEKGSLDVHVLPPGPLVDGYHEQRVIAESYQLYAALVNYGTA